MLGGIHFCLGVSADPMFLWISLNSCPLNLLPVRSHQAEIIIVKRLIQGRNNVTRVWVVPRSCDHGRRKNGVLTLSTTLPTSCFVFLLRLNDDVSSRFRTTYRCKRNEALFQTKKKNLNEQCNCFKRAVQRGLVLSKF